MPGAILGKRTRSTTIAAPSPRSTRAKKRVQILDEDEMGDTIVLRALTNFSPPTARTPTTPKKTRRTPTSAVKSAGRTPLSPQKVNSVFKAAKSSVASVEKMQENIKLQENMENVKLQENVELKVPSTPSRRNKVEVKPTTPRHRVQLVGKPVTPRSKLFGTPTAPVPTTVITTAKALFSRSTTGGKIIGRETERAALTSFITTSLDTNRGGCLYVSGPPGCGKSALLSELTADLSVQKASINCMSLSTPAQIYASLLAAFDVPPPRAPTLQDLEHLFLDAPKPFLLVLDEIDHLPAPTLCTLFALALRPTSRLCLIGIANALDLTDRFLPALKAQGLAPTLLQFLPYTAPQLVTILTTRLRSLLPTSADPTFTPFAHPAALQLLARKVEAASGDLRKAFDILRRSLELVELEHARAPPPSPKALGESTNSATPAPVVWTVLSAPRVGLPHVAKAAALALGSSLSTRIQSLNAHGKAILCILVARAGTQPYGFVKLKDAYEGACKRGEGVKMMPLVGAEFRAVVERLESVGVVEVGGGAGLGTPRKGGKVEERVCSRVGKMELLTAVAGEGRGNEGLRAILSG